MNNFTEIDKWITSGLLKTTKKKKLKVDDLCLNVHDGLLTSETYL